MGPMLQSAPALEAFLDDPRPPPIRSLDLGRGRVMICAADDHQIARESQELGHGVFTHHLLESLKRPRGGAETVSVADIYSEIERGVRDATAGRQEPVVSIFGGKHASLPCFG